MNKRLIISFGLLVVLTAAAVLINFDRSAEAAFLGGANQWATNGTHIYYTSGNVGIGAGTSNPTSPLQVAGQVEATAFTYTSDVRLKKDIVRLNNALDKVINLQGVSFTWKNNGNKEIGLIAQDVEKVVPELVVTGSDGMKSVKYGNVVALLIEAVKAQQIEIDSLKAQLAD